jgi:hypothetical protein
LHVDEQARQWIVSVLENHRALVALAIRQRAKFEGWLKLELAAYAISQGAASMEVESGYGADGAPLRADLTFLNGGERYDVELKTCNTNWRMGGVKSNNQPIAENIKALCLTAASWRTAPGMALLPSACSPSRATISAGCFT